MNENELSELTELVTDLVTVLREDSEPRAIHIAALDVVKNIILNNLSTVVREEMGKEAARQWTPGGKEAGEDAG